MSDEPRERTEKPAVSVVIPVYERTDLLRESLDSVFAQTVDNWEAIVVADHRSADEILSLTSSYEDDRVRTIIDDSSGVSGARNAGIEAVNGEFIAFLDSDDVWHPTKLERQLRRFEHGSSDLAIVYTGFVHQELDGQQWERHPQVSGEVYLKQLEQDWIHPPSTVMVTRECLETVGTFDTSLPTREDYELWIRVTEQYSVGYVDEILVTKREQMDSLSKDFTKRIQGDLAVYEDVRQRLENIDLNLIARNRIHSAHHLVIGRDYESNGDRWKAIRHLSKAVFRYPLQLNAWAMLGIAILGIDRNGPFLTFVKKLLQS